ncbi:MAG: acetate--CoA ligase [Phycisphaeraceae bacterium]|nr:acetate--CoA ligase [Phycisphaeraceae bacterium]
MSQHASGSSIESVLHETRKFPPAAGFSKSAHMGSMEQYRREYERSIRDPEGFWGEVAGELDWFTKWAKVLDWKAPDAKWFVGGKTNICHNCVDRQVEAGFGAEPAIIWEGEPTGSGGPEVRRISYADLKRDVSRMANVLRSLGVGKGDIVTIYMPMVPELAVAMLACARIGAPHSIIFGGFSAQAIADRVVDAGSRVIITADGGWRRGQIVPLKENVDAACTQTDLIDHVIVLERTGQQIAWHHAPSPANGSKRDHWWHDLVQAASDECACEPMDAEDLLFVLYTSGTTGKPKGIMHTTGGYMVHTYLTSKITFDLHPGIGQVYWCTADIGWITGHSYIVYGVLPNRVPTVMYEGAPNWPGADRFWDIVERHKVTQFYTAPTAIRAFMKWGDEHPKKHDLSSLRVLGTVGEPINPEAWMWYHKVIGGEKCPIVDTWWQTETGGHMITPLPGCTATKPGSCTLPFFGVDAAIVDEQGNERGPNEGGLLAIRKPWPSMLRGILGDRERFIATYWSDIVTKDGTRYYKAGDGARRDEDGYFWVMGRIDDVINVSGHRLGTMEVESALVSHDAVVEAAVVGMPHEIKGTGIAAFCTLAPGFAADDALREALRKHVAGEIGAIAKPDMIRFTDALPKTRSGKIMRRLLRDIAEGKEQAGDTTTLEDLSVLAKLRESKES